MMYPHYSTAWAWAGNTPFQWGKQIASHLGGTRNPLVIRFPGASTTRAACDRSSPTSPTSARRSWISSGSRSRRSVDGVEQQPMTGLTFADSFADAGAA